MSNFEVLIRALDIDEQAKSDILAEHIREVNAAANSRADLIDRKNNDIADLNARISALETELADMKRAGAVNLEFAPPRLEVLNFG